MNDKTDAPEAQDAPEAVETDVSNINAYERVVIAAREARRLNEAVRSSSKELRRRVTDVAWERLMEGKVNFTYGEVPIVEEDFEFPELKEDEEGIEAPDLLASMPAAPAEKSQTEDEDEDEDAVEDAGEADDEEDDEDDNGDADFEGADDLDEDEIADFDGDDEDDDLDEDDDDLDR